MEDFGKRLKEERERLGLSQLRFAEACGVGRTAQFNYERGERQPSVSYMDAAEKLGVDSLYVFTGTRKGKDWAYARAYSILLYTIEMFLGLKEGELEKLCKQRVELDEQIDWFNEKPQSERPSIVDCGPWMEAVLRWLGTSQKPDACLDLSFFAQILAEIEGCSVLSAKGLSPDKKAKTAVMLYRSFKASGKIDPKMIEDAMKLAAG